MRTGIIYALVVFFCCVGFSRVNSRNADSPPASVLCSASRQTDSCFSLAGLDGWSLQSAYLGSGADSVELELILLANVPDTWDWNVPVLIGVICAENRPAFARELAFDEPLRTWHIRVHADGKVYLTLKQGEPPTGSPKVVFFKTRYPIH